MKLSPELISEAAGLKSINRGLLARIEQFGELLLQTNRKINLISRAGNQQEEARHQFLASVAALPLIPANRALSWLDIGSGGGFPAIPLAIMRPMISFTLVESTAKKAFFLERASEALALDNVTVINDRAENLSSHRDKKTAFDWLSVKAVAPWRKTLQWGTAHLKPMGKLITWKTPGATADRLPDLDPFRFELLDTMDLQEIHPETPLRIMVLSFLGTHNL